MRARLITRSLAVEERFARLAHAWREGQWRMAGIWEDFRDWLRLGR